MSILLSHEEVFYQPEDDKKRAAVATGSGTATLQVAGDSGVWVDVPDGVITAPGILEFRCNPGLQYRFSITGATVELSGYR